MDDGLVHAEERTIPANMMSLNPCCSGRWSRTWFGLILIKRIIASLNPCCSGRWSRTYLFVNFKIGELYVLILVVVDDGLVLTKEQALKIAAWS